MNGYGFNQKPPVVEEDEEEEIVEQKSLPASNSWPVGSSYAVSPQGDLAHEISRVVFEIQRMDMYNIRERWPEIAQFFADVSCRIPGVTENKGALFLRNMEDLSDIVHSIGMENVAKTKLLKELYALRMEVAVSEVPLLGLSGVSSLLTTKNESRTDAKLSDTRQQTPQSIFSGIASFLGKKEQPQQRGGANPP